MTEKQHQRQTSYAKSGLALFEISSVKLSLTEGAVLMRRDKYNPSGRTQKLNFLAWQREGSGVIYKKNILEYVDHKMIYPQEIITKYEPMHRLS